MSAFKWWAASFIVACLVASTEVFICGWYNHGYSCDLISNRETNMVNASSEQYDFQFELDNEIIDKLGQLDED